jgi:ribosomal protein S18 acetylase RimI-like enzyme
VETIIRDAQTGEEEAIAALIRELAAGEEVASGATRDLVSRYVALPDSSIIVAERDGALVGVLTCFVRPGLFHGGPWASIEELVVTAEARGTGVGDALVAEAMRRFETAGCLEVGVSTEFDNEAAKRLYRKHGLRDESLLLERHFGTGG